MVSLLLLSPAAMFPIILLLPADVTVGAAAPGKTSLATAATMTLTSSSASPPPSSLAAFASPYSGRRRASLSIDVSILSRHSEGNICKTPFCHERLPWLHQPDRASHSLLPMRKRSQHQLLSLAAAVSSSSSQKETTIAAEAATTTKEEVSQMSLSQLLQLLNQSNIRYPPDSTRSQLEELVIQQKIIIKEDGDQSKCDDDDGSSLEDDDDSGDDEGKEAEMLEPPSKSKNGNVKVVDAVVLDEHQPHQKHKDVGEDKRTKVKSCATAEGYNGREERVYGDDGGRKRQDHQQRPRERPQSSSARGARQRQRDMYDREVQRQYYYQQQQQRQQQQRQYYNEDRRHQSTNTWRQRRTTYQNVQTDHNGRIIDLDDQFYLPDNDDPNGRDNDYYDNGMQIFLMGFWEAGKTAAELALDAAVSTVNPFSREGGDGYDEGEWWYDEARGQKVLDANILDYSPRSSMAAEYDDGDGYGGGRKRRRRSRNGYAETSQSGRRRGGRPQGATSGSYSRGRQEYRSDPFQRQRRYYSDDDRSSYYQSSASKQRQPANGREESREEEDFDTEKSQPAQTLAITNESEEGEAEGKTQQRRRRRRRSRDDGPIYGLYSDTNAYDNRNIQSDDLEDQEYHYKKQWKDRLRTKFDAALGIQSPSSSSSSSETYYDSWKVHMKDNVDDGRKEVLRQRMDELDDDSAAVVGGTTSDDATGVDQSIKMPRNNRRARMRAKKSNFNQRYRPLSSSKKSRLDEVPFWREGGTLASLLFDNNNGETSSSSSGMRRDNGRRRPLRRRSLEQLLLSPFGRDHTITSLFLYISRSALASFSILCRWAGVRGTIPQPIVVTTVFAMLLSARRGTRVMAVGLTLLGLRLVGEFVHGSLHGNEFWDDEYDYEEHDWKDKKESPRC